MIEHEPADGNRRGGAIGRAWDLSEVTRALRDPTPLMNSAAVPVFVIVTVCVALVVPTWSEPKLRFVAENVAIGAPVGVVVRLRRRETPARAPRLRRARRTPPPLLRDICAWDFLLRWALYARVTRAGPSASRSRI